MGSHSGCVNRAVYPPTVVWIEWAETSSGVPTLLAAPLGVREVPLF